MKIRNELVPRGEIPGYGAMLLESLTSEDRQVEKWKVSLENYRFESGCSEDPYGWLTCVLALCGVAGGNAGIGCVLADKNGDVIANGHNEVFQPYFRSDLHGEMVVMDKYENMRLDISPSALTLYSSLEPCPMCVVRLLSGGIGSVIYLARDELYGMVEDRGKLPPMWRELADDKVLGTADCSAELMEAAWQIFSINIDELFEMIKNL